MTAVSPRISLGRMRGIANPFARAGRSVVARMERRAALSRPPEYVVLCATVAVLNVVGLVMILSASSVAALSDYGSSWYFFNRQLIWALIGLVAFLVASRIDYRRWRRVAPFLLVIALLTLSVVLVGGKLVSGSQRWIVFGPLQLQPSEIAKLALLLCGAQILTQRADRLDDPRAWRPVVGIFVVFAFLVMKEPDLASTIVLGVILASLLVVGGVRAKHLAQMLELPLPAPRCSPCSRDTGGHACSRSSTRATTSATPAISSTGR
jgi:cell division protein FtsW (lipid II flippase)